MTKELGEKKEPSTPSLPTDSFLSCILAVDCKHGRSCKQRMAVIIITIAITRKFEEGEK
jgi:hypothetical protein